MTSRFVFVMEQGLGHAVHGANLESVLVAQSDIEATILRVRPGETPFVRPMPFTNNWSVQSSWATRVLLSDRLRRGPVDAIFIHTQVAALFAKAIMRRTPTVVSLDATPLDFDTMAGAYGHVRQARVVEHGKAWVNRRALSRAAAIVTWSAWTARSVVRDYHVKAELVHPIHPGVSIDRFQPAVRSGRRGPIKILFVGGDFARKGGHDLLAAMRHVGTDVELHIVSSSRDISIPEGIRASVHRDVPPNSQELRQLYSEADIFALPTRGDCTPLVIAEAMASGLPVVATKVGSIPDMVRDGHNGLLVPPSSPHQVAQALNALLSDEERRIRMGSANRATAITEHDAKTNWQRIFDIMREVSVKAGRPAARPALAT
jgi:glycosyltransferase involved in cell wall biosynthesis